MRAITTLVASARLLLLAAVALLGFVAEPASALTSTTTVLASSANPSVVGQNIVLTATVTSSAATGTVTFKDGTTSLGTVSLASGSASLSTVFLGLGNHSLSASYSGDANYGASTSSPLNLTVVSEPVLPAPPASPTPIVNYEYDANANPTKVIQAPGVSGLNFATSSGYDTLNRRTSTTDAKNGVTYFFYNGRQDLTLIVDPRSLGAETPRNGLGDVVQVAHADTEVATQTFDAAGNLQTRTDGRGVLATYSYDALNRQTSIVYSQSGQTSLTYTWTYDQTGAGFSNGVGRLTSTAHPAGSAQYAYDAQGRLVQDVQRLLPAPGANSSTVVTTVSYEYDSAGNLVSLTYPSGRKLVMTYSAGRPVALSLAKDATSTPAPYISAIEWEPFGAPRSWLWHLDAGTQVHARSFDTSGRLVRYRLGPNVRDVSYDATDRITGYTHFDATTGAPAPALDQSFAYDELGRITSVTTATASWSIAYDANGNRTAVTLNGTSRSYTTPATSNRLVAITNPFQDIGYDHAGNTTGHSFSYSSTYNLAGRMATIDGAGGLATYSVDGMNRRVRKFTNAGASSTIIFVYASDGQLLGEYDSTGMAIREYIWLGPTPVAMFMPDTNIAANPPWHFYIHADHLDTPRVVTDAGGRLRWRWLSEPFGTTAPEINPAGEGDLPLPLRFPGQYADSESGLFYNFHRDYNPTIGRYVQSDPIGLAGGINTYAYVNGNPLMYMDPYGLFGWADMPTAPDWLVNGAAGFGDTLSFGGTNVVRNWMDVNGSVNRCSSAYSNGEWGAVGVSLAFGGAHLGRNALYQMGKGGLGRGLGRLVSDGRTWGSVRDTWSVAAGNGERWLAANGQSLHHWLIPQRFASVNAGFNYMPISAGFNSWMNGSTAFRTAVEWGFRGSVAGIYGAPITAAVSGDDCTCQK